MINRLRAFFLSLTIVSILLVSAFGTAGTVYADDGAPPEATETSTPSGEEESTPEVAEETTAPEVSEETASPEATEETAPPEVSEETATPEASEETATPEAAEATPAPEETATPEAGEPTAQPEESTPAEDVESADEGVTEEETLPLLEQLPENTTVTVLNEEGEPQPLAAQSSVEAIESDYDPIWCPDGQDPTPGANGCTPSFSSFDELLSYLEENQDNPAFQQAGTIYIQEGNYLGGESSVDFNNYNLNNTQNYNLTLQGGWNPSSGSTNTTTTFNNVPLTIGSSTNPWAGSLTLVNLNINGVSDQTGLTLYTDEDITLNNVDVTTSLNGAELNAGGDVTIDDSSFNKNKNKGASINSGGDVKITNTTFNKNGTSAGNTGKGLDVSGSGSVTLAGVEASYNQVFGANVSTTGAVTITDSFFSGNKSYTYKCWTKSYNGGYGLQVVTTEDVKLDGVEASNNFFFGADIEGADIEVLDSKFNFNSSGYENYPTGYGLQLGSTGAVNLNGIEANNNQWFGANVEAVDTVNVFNSIFNGNKSYKYYMQGAKGYHGYGLQVVTTGDIILDTVSTLNNNLFGTSLDGASVTINGSNFNGNGSGVKGDNQVGKGLTIVSTGRVNLSNVNANNNLAYGANINAGGSVSITNSFFSGQKAYVYDCKGKSKGANGGGYGLKVVSGDVIALNSVEASNNYLYGAQLKGASVNVSTGKFNDNGSGKEDKPTGFGLKVISAGDASLVTVEANNNQFFGADVQAGGSVNVSEGFFSNNHASSWDPTGHMMMYYGYGLTVNTPGSISVDGVEGHFNNLWGANLTGSYVSVSNSKFNNNVTDTVRFIDDTGLFVQSSGDVSLFNVEAKENRLFGASIQAGGNVFVSNSVFTDTKGITCQDQACKVLVYDGIGLNIIADGEITLFDVTADNNMVTGAHLEGSNIFITDSSFDNTGSDDPKQPTGRGLEVISTGEVTLDGVTANDNELFGAAIEAVGPVTITNSEFSGNMAYVGGCHYLNYVGFGLLVLTTSPVTLDNVTANDNNMFGAALNGSLVEVTNSFFNNNGSGSTYSSTGEGLKIHSTGDVILDNVQTIGNELVGADIVADGNITVSNSIFSGTTAYGGDGLRITSGGTVTLTNVIASGNKGDGVDVNGACGGTLVVNGGTFSNNNRYGVRTNVPYSASGSPSFAGNGSGNVFQGSNCFTSPASQNAQNMPGTGMPWWMFWWMKWDDQQAKGN